MVTICTLCDGKMNEVMDVETGKLRKFNVNISAPFDDGLVEIAEYVAHDICAQLFRLLIDRGIISKDHNITTKFEVVK